MNLRFLPVLETVIFWAGGLFALITLAVLFYGIRRGLHRSAGRASGRLQGWLRLPVFYILAGMVFFGLCYLAWRPLPFSFPPHFRLWSLVLGALIYFAGLGLVLWGRLALGREYFVSTVASAQLFAGHRLVTTGPYALVRHPMYLGILLAGLGGILLYHTLTMVFITLMGFGLRVRAWREEQVLAAEFGPQWQEYCRRVPGFFPHIRKIR